MNAADLLFLGFAGMTILGGFLAVELKNIFHNALFLGMSLLGVAGLFILLGSEFLALVQILVYVGAILIAILFAIMITPALSLKDQPRNKIKQILGALTSLGFTGILLFLLLTALPLTWKKQITTTQDVFHIKKLGELLISEHALPFEIISVLLLITILGALLNVRDVD